METFTGSEIMKREMAEQEARRKAVMETSNQPWPWQMWLSGRAMMI